MFQVRSFLVFSCLLIHLSCFGASLLLGDLLFLTLFVNFVKLRFSTNLKARNAFICNVSQGKYLVQTIEMHVLLYYCFLKNDDKFGNNNEFDYF